MNSATLIVLILDALDECPQSFRPEMIEALRIGASLLPTNVKLFLTSRPQNGVSLATEELFPKYVHISVGLGQDDNDDLRCFIAHKLSEIRKSRRLENSWSEAAMDRDTLEFSSKACGLFQWTSVTCALIGRRFDPPKAIHRILNLPASAEAQVNLDTLYTNALRQVLPDAEEDTDLRLVYTQVVGTIIVAKEPLDVLAPCDLLDLLEGTVNRLLTDLGCVISVELERGLRVAHVAHPSFFDFVTSDIRCADVAFFLDHMDASQFLGLRCLIVATERLRHNLGGVDSDNELAGDVPARNLLGSLRYGSRFTLVYVGELTRLNPSIVRLLDVFLDTKLME